jgi:hypothetical protein
VQNLLNLLDSVISINVAGQKIGHAKVLQRPNNANRNEQ